MIYILVTTLCLLNDNKNNILCQNETSNLLDQNEMSNLY
jgi:agmatine/peptidylarginine deiminase